MLPSSKPISQLFRSLRIWIHVLSPHSTHSQLSHAPIANVLTARPQLPCCNSTVHLLFSPSCEAYAQQQLVDKAIYVATLLLSAGPCLEPNASETSLQPSRHHQRKHMENNTDEAPAITTEQRFSIRQRLFTKLHGKLMQHKPLPLLLCITAPSNPNPCHRNVPHAH